MKWSTVSLILGVCAAGCEGQSEENTIVESADPEGTTTTNTPSTPGQPGAPAASDVPADRGVPSGESSLHSPSDPSDVVPEGPLARTTIQFGRLGSVSMKRPIEHIFSEGINGGATEIYLQYVPTYSSESFLMLRLPYLEGTSEVRIPDAGGISFSERRGDESVTLSATKGTIRVLRTGAGMRIELDDIEMTTDDETAATEVFGDGVIEGQLERSCTSGFAPESGVILNGSQPVKEARLDADWSSPFCAQYR